MKNVSYLIPLLVAPLVLSACGGSGSGSDLGPGGDTDMVDKKITSHTTDDIFDSSKVKSISMELNGHRFQTQDQKGTDDKIMVADFGVLPAGLSDGLAVFSLESIDGNNWKTDLKTRSYNQFYSVVYGHKPLRSYENGKLLPSNGSGKPFLMAAIAGKPTPIENIPVKGSATYTGVAFNEDSRGDFAYTINFADKTGSGKITGLGGQDITLKKGNIVKYSAVESTLAASPAEVSNPSKQTIFTGETSKSGNKYIIGLYGPHAEEASGVVGDDIGVGGKRGEIK